MLIWTLEKNFSEILSEIQTSYKEIHLIISSVKWRQSCLGLNMLITIYAACVEHIMLRPEYCDWRFADNIFEYIFLHEKYNILLKFGLSLCLSIQLPLLENWCLVPENM